MLEIRNLAPLVLLAACNTGIVEPQHPELTSEMGNNISHAREQVGDVLQCSSEQFPKRAVTGNIDGKIVTACLDDEIPSLAVLQKGCEKLSADTKTPFVLDAVTYTGLNHKPDTGTYYQAWVCRPILTQNDKISPATFCDGKWMTWLNIRHQKEQTTMAYHYECWPDPYGSRLHYILTNCPKEAQDTTFPLGTFREGLDRGFRIGTAKNDPTRTVLYDKCE